MYILLISSTENEISPTLSWLSSVNGIVNDHEVEILITGVGSTATTYALTRHLLWRTPELVIQACIGGSFSWEMPPPSVAFIKEEVIADLGAVHNGELSDIFDLGLAAEDELPFTNRMLVNQDIE